MTNAFQRDHHIPDRSTRTSKPSRPGELNREQNGTNWGNMVDIRTIAHNQDLARVERESKGRIYPVSTRGLTEGVDLSTPGIKAPRGPGTGHWEGPKWKIPLEGSQGSNGVSNKRPRDVTTRRQAPFVDLIEGASSHPPKTQQSGY